MECPFKILCGKESCVSYLWYTCHPPQTYDKGPSEGCYQSGVLVNTTLTSKQINGITTHSRYIPPSFIFTHNFFCTIL
jgi:hypothetical protein